MAQDREGWLNTASFDEGVMNIFWALCALIARTIGEYRIAADHNDHWAKTEVRRAEAESAIWRASLEAIVIFLVLIVGGAIAVPLLTNPLNEQMVHIIEGVSRLAAGIVMGLLSIRVAIWLDVYYGVLIELPEKLGTTLKELKHRVRWAVSKKFLRMFYVLLVFFQGADAVTIPVSILAGLACGFVTDYIIYKLRRVESPKCRKYGCIALVILFVAVAIIQIMNGVFFIAAVWDDSVDDVDQITWDGWVGLVLVVLVPILHVAVWRWGERQRRNDAEEGVHESNTSGNDPMAKMKRQRMATSMFISTINRGSKTDKEEPLPPLAEAPADATEDSPAKAAPPPESPLEEGTPEENVEVPIPETINEEEEAEEVADNKPEEELEQQGEEPTLWQLLMDWQCCGAVRGDDKTTPQKVFNATAWVLYAAVTLLCLFNLVNNIGATYQQEHARSKLPEVNKLIYATMDEGPVCAFDNKGADSNITTFPDKDAAHAAGFLVLHCGACGACSDWHNLELEYTTREFLAQEGRKCAQQSLFGGGYDSLVECLESDAIGFQGQCAICWADDILCTKGFCWAIGLQSFFINTLTNYAVQNNTITAAACEEAHCEAGNPGSFVYCSGATRRRMDVKSDINRPGAQQCTISDVDWPTLFPDPHPSQSGAGTMNVAHIVGAVGLLLGFLII